MWRVLLWWDYDYLRWASDIGVFFFFFQAEDGIRDYKVTGVQTCALPIYRKSVQHVQITVAETVGVEKRGKYYEEAGVVRDMFQNHLLQLLTLVAMEPPVDRKSVV